MSWTRTSCPPSFSAALSRNKWLGIGAPQVPHSVDGLPPKSRNCGVILLSSLFSLSPAWRLTFWMFVGGSVLPNIGHTLVSDLMRFKQNGYSLEGQIVLSSLANFCFKNLGVDPPPPPHPILKRSKICRSNGVKSNWHLFVDIFPSQGCESSNGLSGQLS